MTLETTPGKGNPTEGNPITFLGVSEISTRYSFNAFELDLSNGLKINLPPIAKDVIVDKLQHGDRFVLSPREDVIEGELRKFDDQTTVEVFRGDERLLSFIVGNHLILTA